MKIAIVDDGVGAFAALYKFRRVLCADYLVVVTPPLGQTRTQLFAAAQQALDTALQQNCNAVVFSSISLSVAAAKILAKTCPVPLYGCEAPILHASTYTASQVLLVADKFVASLANRFSGVISLPLPQFSALAESGASDSQIAAYIEQSTQDCCGKFDCIALGSSSMNLYKHCFSRVFPNVQIFDSLDGVARKLRKNHKKSNREESTLQVLALNGEDLLEKYKFFIDEFGSHY